MLCKQCNQKCNPSRWYGRLEYATCPHCGADNLIDHQPYLDFPSLLRDFQSLLKDLEQGADQPDHLESVRETLSDLETEKGGDLDWSDLSPYTMPDDQSMVCPCGADMYLLGTLGNLNWYRCRGCGLELHRDANHQTSPVETLIGLMADSPLYQEVEWGNYEGSPFLIMPDWATVENLGVLIKSVNLDPDLAEIDNDRVLDHYLTDQWGFSDEYDLCSDCQTVIRTQPDSYHWQCDFWQTEDGDLYCADCVRSKYQQDYLDWANWNADRAVNTDLIPLADLGFVQIEHTFESGLHYGMDDNPRAILQSIGYLRNQIDAVYTISPSQFYVSFYLWVRYSDAYREDNPEVENVFAAEQVFSAIAA